LRRNIFVLRCSNAKVFTMRSAATWLLSLALASGCGAPRAHYAPLDSDGSQLRAPDGRAVILRGMNARVAGVFDVTLDGGRAPVETVPDFGDDDAAKMAALGFNLLRLPLSWSGIEPVQGQYSTDYLDRVAAVVDDCRHHGILVLLDFHQDAWSKEIGEDGAPRWAIVPPPTMLLSGPLTDLDQRRASAQVMAAFQSFFEGDAQRLQEAFAQMAAEVARRFSADQAVLGYELFNEPVASDDVLLPFDVEIARAIRAVDARHLIAFEPDVIRNYTGSTELAAAPFPVGGALYAPHIYTGVFGADMRLAQDSYEQPMAESWQSAREEAQAWKTPLLVGELGVGPSQPNAYAWIGHALDDADQNLASTAFWLWKEESQGGWGLFDLAPDGSWTERPQMIAAVSRPYPQAIGGDPTGIHWDGATLTVTFTGKSGVPPVHDLFFPGSAPTVRCDGAEAPSVTVDAGAIYHVRCGGPGAHTLTLAR
jgi:endoglycosylceramidase